MDTGFSPSVIACFTAISILPLQLRRRAVVTYNSHSSFEGVRFSCWTHSWCFHSLLLSPSWLFSFPPLNNMLKFSGWSWWRDGLKIVCLFWKVELKLALCLWNNNVQAAFLFSQVILLLSLSFSLPSSLSQEKKKHKKKLKQRPKEPSSPSFLLFLPLSPSYSPSFHFWRCWLKQYVLAFKNYNWCLTLTYFSSLFIYYYVLHRKRIQDIHDWHCNQ